MGVSVGSSRTIRLATSSIAGRYPCNALPMNAGVTARRISVWLSLAHQVMIRSPNTISCGAIRRSAVPNDNAPLLSWKTARTSSGEEVHIMVGISGTFSTNRSPSLVSSCRAASGAMNNLAQAAAELLGRGKVLSVVNGDAVGVAVLIGAPGDGHVMQTIQEYAIVFL